MILKICLFFTIIYTVINVYMFINYKYYKYKYENYKDRSGIPLSALHTSQPIGSCSIPGNPNCAGSIIALQNKLIEEQRLSSLRNSMNNRNNRNK